MLCKCQPTGQMRSWGELPAVCSWLSHALRSDRFQQPGAIKARRSGERHLHLLLVKSSSHGSSIARNDLSVTSIWQTATLATKRYIYYLVTNNIKKTALNTTPVCTRPCQAPPVEPSGDQTPETHRQSWWALDVSGLLGWLTWEPSLRLWDLCSVQDLRSTSERCCSRWSPHARCTLRRKYSF